MNIFQKIKKWLDSLDWEGAAEAQAKTEEITGRVDQSNDQ
jgi:hypothetical protein